MWTLVPIILLCSSSLPTNDCTEERALVRIVAPYDEGARGGGHVACLHLGLLYAAGSHLVTPGTYPKIICAPPERVAHVHHLDERNTSGR